MDGTTWDPSSLPATPNEMLAIGSESCPQELNNHEAACEVPAHERVA
jgi:hypothetical protein